MPMKVYGALGQGPQTRQCQCHRFGYLAGIESAECRGDGNLAFEEIRFFQKFRAWIRKGDAGQGATLSKDPCAALLTLDVFGRLGIQTT